MKAEQAKKLADEALDNLTAAVAAGKSESLTAYLAAMGKFHDYSFGNVMLILSQRPDASRVAGYRTWQTLGRQVRKGEKGITIIAPMMLKREAEQQEDDPEKVLRFKATSVFDVSQTDGNELPQPAQMQGTPREHLQRLEQFITGLGIVLELRMDIGQAAGVSMGGHICIRPELSPAERFSVLVHELAHEMLHHGEGAQRGDKQTRELEAEAVAYVVSSGIGLEPGTACSDYIHTYGGDAEKLAAMAKLFVCNTYRDSTAMAQQIFGGVGFTLEYEIQLYFRRAKALQLSYNDTRRCEEIIAAAVLD